MEKVFWRKINIPKELLEEGILTHRIRKEASHVHLIRREVLAWLEHNAHIKEPK